MSEELLDEVISINSIYGDGTLLKVSQDATIYALTLPTHSSISTRLEFPSDYPDTPPSIIGTQSVADDVAKGEGVYLLDVLRGVLCEVYTPGTPCIFDLIEVAGVRLQQLSQDQNPRSENGQAPQANGQLEDAEPSEVTRSDGKQPKDAFDEQPPWTLSEIVTEKKSVFVARVAAVPSVDEAKQYLGHLLATDKKVAKATHNITAWRIKGENSVQYQDCDDDGETAAGGRLLHLMELMDIWDAMVVVTRWYGGVQLGPDRFRIINQTARDALMKGGFGHDEKKAATKKHGKK